MIIVYMLLVGAIIWGAAAVYGFANRPRPNISRSELAALRQREQLASEGLRVIAGGDALPVITAGEYLNRVNATYNRKEI